METLHRQHWEDVSSVADGDWDDDETETEVRDFLDNNLHRISPYANAHPGRLNADNNFLTFDITSDHIISIITSMRKTCPGHSGTSKTIMRHLLPEAISYLTKTFKAALSAGYFSDRLKQATIRLIPKGGERKKHYPSHYRLISLLEVPGKILKRIINHRLRTYLKDSDLHNNLHFDFRSGRGTTHALALATETVVQQKADGGQCHLILRDITKAFDKVWHLGMKYSILHLGLLVILEKLFCDFLDDRSA